MATSSLSGGMFPFPVKLTCHLVYFRGCCVAKAIYSRFPVDRKRHFPALGHVEGNSVSISVSGWKIAGKAQHVIQKEFSLSRFGEATRGLWFRGSSTVGDHYCHSSTSEGRYLLFAQQNSSTEEPHLNWGFARLVGSVSQEINFIKTIAAGINFLAIADSRTSFWISDFEYQILIFFRFLM